ncbi:MAG: phytoene desaturase [Taibaiella sp.]|nr:phytoene desaturase [Taibaiella sp.]
MSRRIAIIGSGFSGLAAASFAAAGGADVTVFEKNDKVGGRARTFSASGYLFDMGPSWYWMPDVFDNFFASFGKKTEEYYQVKKLDPGFRVFFGRGDMLDIPADTTQIFDLFEKEEKGAADKLKRFLAEAETKYHTAFRDFIYKPSASILEFMSLSMLAKAIRLDLFQTFENHAKKFFKSPRLLQLVEFPILFLGGTSRNIPALYSMMNYSAFVQGTWYPMGGFSAITNGMAKLAKELGVEILTGKTVEKINASSQRVNELIINGKPRQFDGLIASADYAHAETLLEENYRNYDDKYWSNRTMSPSSLIFYIGVRKKIVSLQHHNLFFDEDFTVHASEIYDSPSWPSAPLFYVCCPSKTDPGVAPEGHENLFILMPLAAGLQDTQELRERYFDIIMSRLEKITGENIRPSIDYKSSYCINDFANDYNSYKGNAYGLANTLMQTAILKPSLRNKKIRNMYYAGQLTVPGPGVPPALISGQIAAEQLLKTLKI